MTDNEFGEFLVWILSQKLKTYSFTFLSCFPETMKARTSFCFVFKGKSEMLMSLYKDICREVSQNQWSHKLHCTSLSFKNCALFLTSYILKVVGVGLDIQFQILFVFISGVSLSAGVSLSLSLSAFLCVGKINGQIELHISNLLSPSLFQRLSEKKSDQF